MEAQRKVDEAPSADEEKYASVFAPVSTLNEVHVHCMEIVGLHPKELRKAVKQALAQGEKWDTSQKEMVKPSVAKSLPALGKLLLHEPDLPVPRSFSTECISSVDI